MQRTPIHTSPRAFYRVETNYEDGYEVIDLTTKQPVIRFGNGPAGERDAKAHCDALDAGK